MFNLGGVDTSPTYLLEDNAFPLVLDSNLHDLNETKPGLTLFSAELPWCCFLCRNKSSRNGTKLCEDFLYQ